MWLSEMDCIYQTCETSLFMHGALMQHSPQPTKNTKLHLHKSLKCDNRLFNFQKRVTKTCRQAAGVIPANCVAGVCVCVSAFIHVHLAHCAVCKSYNEKTGEASNTVVVLPFISALHKLHTSCHLRKDLFEIQIYTVVVFCLVPSVLILYLWLAVKGTSCDVCMRVCVYVWLSEDCW